MLVLLIVVVTEHHLKLCSKQKMKSKSMPAKTKKKTQLPEAEFAVEFSRLSLQLVGVWPDLECSRFFTIISNIVFFISLVLIAYFIIVAQTTKLFLIGGDLDTIVDILCTADIPVSIALIKMIVLRYDSQGRKVIPEFKKLQ